MEQKTASDGDGSDYEDIREELKTTKGVERSSLDMGDDDHALSGMDSKRQAPVEAVAKNVVERYDDRSAFIREYLANAHTACIQRAKWELRDAGVTDLDYSDVRAVLERASEEVGYEPVITVKRNENPEDFALKIEDNGIGITSETAYAIRDIGLSGWHDDGSTNGQFGQGTMSGFLAVDHWGEFDMTTKSVISDENYRARWKLTDLDKLPGERDSYGTTFTFPYFIDEAEEIDTYERVREYVEGMIVPVIYEHYDEDGTQNGNLSDDWGASYIEDRYADSSPVVTYEDDYGKVVWSPDDPEGWSSSLKTFCGYQPIDRNDTGFGVNSYSMPSGFDVRVKVEDGSIVSVPEDADDSLVGKVAVSQNRYEHLPDDQKDEHVPRSEVPDEAVIAPEPTDDRDRFESKHVPDYMSYYASKLEDEFKSHVADVIEGLDGLESLPELDDSDRQLLLTGIDEYVDVYKKNDPDRLQEDIEEEFGVEPNKMLASNIGVVKSEFGDSVSDEFATAVGRMKQARLGSTDDEETFSETVQGMTNTVSLATRGRKNVSRKSNREDTPVWEVVDMAGDDGTVFMAKTLTCQRKIELAWELHEDNQVVVVGDYEKWEDMFDWKKLKDLPSEDFQKHVDTDLDDDWLDEWDPAVGDDTADDSGSDIGNMSYDDERAKRKSVKVRFGTGGGYFTEKKGQTLFEKLDDGETVRISYKGRFDKLVIYRATEGHSASVGKGIAGSDQGVAYAVVPDYVYDYLKHADNVFEREDYGDFERSKWMGFDWSSESFRQGAEVQDLDERDVVVYASDEIMDPIEERNVMDEFVDALEDRLDAYGVDEVRSVTFRRSLDEYYQVINRRGFIQQDEKPSLVSVSTTGVGTDSFGYGYDVTTSIDVEEMFFDSVLPDLDREAYEWSHFDPDMEDEELIDALQDLSDAGGFVSTDDDSSLPEYGDHDELGISTSAYYAKQTMDRFAEETDYLDDEV